MYLAKFDKRGMRWNVQLYEKRWSEIMLSNEISPIAEKNFIFHASGYRWANKEISRHLFENHRLEIING